MEALISEKEEEEKMEMGVPRSLKQQQELLMKSQKGKLGFSFEHYLSSHSSLQISQNQKKVFITMHPLHGILASVGDDEILRLWDIHQCGLIDQKNLGSQASCLSFSPDGNFLAIGLVNGTLLLLDSQIQKFNLGTSVEKINTPAFDVIMSPKDSRAAIL